MTGVFGTRRSVALTIGYDENELTAGHDQMKRLRIYIDTSVVGGCFDDEFAEYSEALLAMADQQSVVLIVSDMLAEELEGAPAAVRERFGRISEDGLESVRRSNESVALHQMYVRAKVVGPASANDALHVAIATCTRADVIASWNFRHIVHLDKIRGFNAVNLDEGYPAIEIRSPREIV